MLSKKGITPVIAVVMLVLIVVTLVGGIFIWLQTMVDETGEDISDHVRGETDAMGKNAVIDGCSDDNVYIRSTGTNPIQEGEIAVYVNGTHEDDIPIQGEGEIDTGIYTYSTELPGEVRITGPGFEDIEDC